MNDIFKYLEDKRKEKPEYIELTKDEYIECCRLSLKDGNVGYYRGIPIKIKDEGIEQATRLFDGLNETNEDKEPMTVFMMRKIIEELKETKFANEFLQIQLEKLKKKNEELEEYKWMYEDLCK